MGLKIKNGPKGGPMMMYLYGLVGDEYGGVTSDQFRQEMANMSGDMPIELHIHSDGGSFLDALSMNSQLSQRKGPVDVVIDGIAASAASLVAMAGKTISMSQHSWMMAHYGLGTLRDAPIEEFKKAIGQMEMMNQEIHAIYMPRWSGTADELSAGLQNEIWLNANDTVKCGLADSICEAMSIAACISPQMKFKNTPKELLTSGPSPAIAALESKLAAMLG